MKNKQKFTSKQYKLTKEAAPLSYMLPTRNTSRYPLMYFDETTGQNRALRYARNQKTPFEDEQDGNAVLEPVIFDDGFLDVQKENQILQQFLHLHPMNGSKFIEIDDVADAAKEVEILNLELDALIAARGLSIDMCETVSRVLFNHDIAKYSTAELKRDILIFAKREPEEFLNILDDPTLKLQGKIALFFDKGFIAYRKNNKEVWYNTTSNKSRMVTIPFGEDAIYVVSSFLTSDDGIESLKMLEKLAKE